MTSRNFKQSMVNQDQEIIFEVVKASGSWAFPAASSIVEATRGKNMYLRLTDSGKSDIFRLDYVKPGRYVGETVFGFVGRGGMDLVELTATTDGTGATTGSWEYEPGDGPAGEAISDIDLEIVVFEVHYSQQTQDWVYPTYEELDTARKAGKLVVIDKISPEGIRTYYAATQMSVLSKNVNFRFVDAESGTMLKLEGPTSNPVWSTGSVNEIKYVSMSDSYSDIQDIISHGQFPVMKVVSGQGYNYYYPSFENSNFVFKCVTDDGIYGLRWNGSAWAAQDAVIYGMGSDTKTESDIVSGTLSVDGDNTVTSVTLTTVNAITFSVNETVPAFALEIDNTGNSNDVDVTVVKGATTLKYSTAAGSTVAAGKFVQLTCVGSCWTLAEFEAPVTP